MGISQTRDDRGIAEIVVDVPPVNALTVAGWFELADTVTAAGKDPETRVVVLRSEGKGFNAGVDIKEMQNTEGFAALIGANKGCFAAFAAVYDCPVPLIAAVQRLLRRWRHRPHRQRRHRDRQRRRLLRAPRGRPRRPGRGDAPGPTGAPTQDAGDGLHRRHRHRGRAPRLRLRAPRSCRATSCADAALEVAADIARKSPTVIRAAKESLNGIDLWDVKRSYRFEQGFTFELNLSGVSDELRDAFVDKRDADTSR